MAVLGSILTTRSTNGMGGYCNFLFKFIRPKVAYFVLDLCEFQLRQNFID